MTPKTTAKTTVKMRTAETAASAASPTAARSPTPRRHLRVVEVGALRPVRDPHPRNAAAKLRPRRRRVPLQHRQRPADRRQRHRVHRPRPRRHPPRLRPAHPDRRGRHPARHWRQAPAPGLVERDGGRGGNRRFLQRGWPRRRCRLRGLRQRRWRCGRTFTRWRRRWGRGGFGGLGGTGGAGGDLAGPGGTQGPIVTAGGILRGGCRGGDGGQENGGPVLTPHRAVLGAARLRCPPLQASPSPEPCTRVERAAKAGISLTEAEAGAGAARAAWSSWKHRRSRLERAPLWPPTEAVEVRAPYPGVYRARTGRWPPPARERADGGEGGGAGGRGGLGSGGPEQSGTQGDTSVSGGGGGGGGAGVIKVSGKLDGCQRRGVLPGADELTAALVGRDRELTRRQGRAAIAAGARQEPYDRTLIRPSASRRPDRIGKHLPYAAIIADISGGGIDDRGATQLPGGTGRAPGCTPWRFAVLVRGDSGACGGRSGSS